MIVARRPTLHQQTAAVAASTRFAGLAGDTGLAPPAPVERQERHGTGLDGRSRRGAAAGAAFGRAAAVVASGFAAHLLAQAPTIAPFAAAVPSTPGAGAGTAAYRSTQKLLERQHSRTENHTLFGPYPTAFGNIDIQV